MLEVVHREAIGFSACEVPALCRPDWVNISANMAALVLAVEASKKP